MIQVKVYNLEFEIWANQLLTGKPIMEMLDRIADYTVRALDGEMEFSQPTGKTERALTKRTAVSGNGAIFSVGVGSMNDIGSTSDTKAPENTIRDFYSWYRKKLKKSDRGSKWYA